MTSSWRHNTKFWGGFLNFSKFQTNIYQTVARNKHHLKRFSSYIQVKRSRFAVFRSSRESGESGTVTFHVSLFKCPGWKFVGKVWNFCVLLLDDVTSWWMFKWRSGALARAQMYCDGRPSLSLRSALYLLLDMRVIYATTMSPSSPGRRGPEGNMRA